VLCSAIAVADYITGFSDDITATVRAPFYYTLNLPSRIAYMMSVEILAKKNLLEQNSSLKTQVAELQAQQTSLENAVKENKVLRELLSSSSRVKAEFTHAEIIALGNDIGRNIVIINKGRSDDVKEGQALVDAYGVFGHIISVSSYTSKVLLVTDKDSFVPIQTDSGLRAILQGSGNSNELELIDATSTTKFKAGDKLYTSGLALRYMPGYPVGEVENISIGDKSAFIKVRVKPYAHLDSSRQLLLVWLPEDKIIAEAKASSSENKPS
jgi:rod shape-determining protein MreC